jgi:hypothetical protein
MSEQPQAPEVALDDSQAAPTYANFCRATTTPEEVILDFGLNPQPYAAGKREVTASQRIVMDYFTAKRRLMVLGMTVQRQERTFGAIELDPGRRAAGAQAQPPVPQGQSGWETPFARPEAIEPKP